MVNLTTEDQQPEEHNANVRRGSGQLWAVGLSVIFHTKFPTDTRGKKDNFKRDLEDKNRAGLTATQDTENLKKGSFRSKNTGQSHRSLKFNHVS